MSRLNQPPSRLPSGSSCQPEAAQAFLYRTSRVGDLFKTIKLPNPPTCSSQLFPLPSHVLTTHHNRSDLEDWITSFTLIIQGEFCISDTQTPWKTPISKPSFINLKTRQARERIAAAVAVDPVNSLQPLGREIFIFIFEVSLRSSTSTHNSFTKERIHLHTTDRTRSNTEDHLNWGSGNSVRLHKSNHISTFVIMSPFGDQDQ